MTDLEHHWADRLAGVRMLPGSYEKRFIRDMASRSMGGKPLSEKQRTLLGNLLYRYRRQLKLSDESARKHREKIQMGPVEERRMTEDEAFLAAIIESPDDDAPRMAYSDCLQERGDPRGEFVAVQLALAKLPPPLLIMPQLREARVHYEGNPIEGGSGITLDWEDTRSFIEGECREEELQPILDRMIAELVIGRELGTIGNPTHLVRVEHRSGRQTFTFPKCALTLPEQARRLGGGPWRVRLQVLPLEPDEQRAEELRKRERELLLASSGQPTLTNCGWWVKQAVGSEVYRYLEGTPTFRRGFVERISLPASVWLEHSEELRRAAPIQEVELTSLSYEDWQRIAGKYRNLHFSDIFHVNSAETAAVLGHLWPGISFTVPVTDFVIV